MLIRDADVLGIGRNDVHIAGARVTAIAPALSPLEGERVIEARGGALLPGLHDHHIHLVSLAAALNSVQCGPPQVRNADALAAILAAEETRDRGWLRGIGYHESVAGDIDRHWLDRHIPSRPVRIQHRSGQMWILNSCALDRIGAGDVNSPAERIGGAPSGRIFRGDDWLRARLRGQFPDLSRVSALLAQRGVTGITDTSASNDSTQAQCLWDAQVSGALRQNVMVMGTADLDGWAEQGPCRRGPFKIHLNETVLPDFDALVAAIRRGHDAGRAVAAHCVTRTELMFVLAAVEEAGALRGDRIEHASIAPPEAVDTIAHLGLTVVTQPNFLWERGDAYLTDVDPADRPWLYRGRGFLDRGIALAAGTDAPFGEPEPWCAMQAAVARRTRSGAIIAADEALSPDQALALYLGAPENPGGPPRRIEVGATADLCLLDRPLQGMRDDFAAVAVLMTWRGGEIIWNDNDRFCASMI
jgi:predicted amidohydrolase YtcJ